MNLEPLGLSMKPVFAPGPRLLTAEELDVTPVDEPWKFWNRVLRKVPEATAYLSGLGPRVAVMPTESQHVWNPFLIENRRIIGR